MTTTGNGIFVCYDDNQQQQASMACHAFPISINNNKKQAWCGWFFLKDKKSKKQFITFE